MARKLAALSALACSALALPAAVLAGNGGVAPPDAATPSGDTINEIYWVVLAACIVVFLAIEGTLLLFVFRFRRRAGTPADVEGPQIHGNTRLEIAWTVVPTVALVAITVFTFVRLPDVLASPGEGEESQRVRVEAHQFYWQYEYPNGALSFDTLYLPVDKPATLELASRDVDHSWWVPELTGKLDAIPGRVNRLHFTPTRTGTFENGKCGEFCGIQHAAMLTRVRVVSEEEFERWLDENAPTDEEGALTELGREEWEAACAKCHGLNGEGDIGPPVAGNGTLQNVEGLTRLLYSGQNTEAIEHFMPPVGRGWSERQVNALLAYVRSNRTLLRGPGAGGGEGDGGAG